MSKSDFKPGDIVYHKSTSNIRMVILGNCAPENPTTKQLADGYKDPNIFECRYYEKDLNVWKKECFYSFELTFK